ncbi:prepilin peptidase [Acidisphaera sp. S103]|uniref:preprotein translocase subunit SecA n=1 Tax=Acidisphaera sp. S103 TaxID=1747223 RepID=UPI00131CD039|nr:prepilin peptidase [Acidisphaera sp. S103]
MSATTIPRPSAQATAAPALRLARAVPYPERHTRPRGVVEEHLRVAAALLLPGPPQMLWRLAARRVARLAAGYAAEAAGSVEASEAAAALRVRLRDGISPDSAARAFALIRVLAARHLGMTPYDVQLMAAWSMLRGHMTELATGEGKTLAASLAAATAALAGRMVHVVTVNDYLAERDHGQLSPLYRALGLTTGLIIHGQTPAERRAAYACDIVYTSNKELVFDYLRDQMHRRSTLTALHARVARLDGRRGSEDALVMRGLDFAIVDEADSVLIDEARTPLIISETASDAVSDDVCVEALDLVTGLTEGLDYTIDRSERRIDMTPGGRRRVELLSESLGEHWGSTLVRSELVVKALTARLLFERDVHYLLRDGKVCIIDEYTGRVMADRFWNDGLHQMIEAKEGCAPSGQRASVARITYQRFFTRYQHLCGMSGTLAEVTRELRSVYGVGVIRIPTHHPGRRRVEKTQIVPTAEAKWRAIADHAVRFSAAGRPVLIGTRSVAASELASGLLRGHGVAHNLLNAAQDAAEAAIVARAGEAGCVTIATNMAGRGTDIRLAPGVSDRGGLAVILSDRHDAARIDRQLAGRGARQGDAGSFTQVLSLEDALMDPLRSNPAARLLLAAARGHRLLACILFSIMQRRAERRHRIVRRELMRFEARLQGSLSFAGRPD